MNTRALNPIDQLWNAISKIHNRLDDLEVRNNIADLAASRMLGINLSRRVCSTSAQSVSLAMSHGVIFNPDVHKESRGESVHFEQTDFKFEVNTEPVAAPGQDEMPAISQSKMNEQEQKSSDESHQLNKIIRDKETAHSTKEDRDLEMDKDAPRKELTDLHLQSNKNSLDPNAEPTLLTLQEAAIAEAKNALSNKHKQNDFLLAPSERIATGEEEMPEETEHESIENRIGLYWLSRLGIGFLVVGAALLVVYSFPYFGAWAKLLTGFLIAGSLLLAGEKIDTKQKMTWLGNACAGGGWSLAFFCSYAMHNVESVRVIDDPIIGTLAMLAVAGGSTFHSIRKNSELIGSFSTILGFIALSLNGISSITAPAFSILCLNFTVLAQQKKWLGLYSSGLVSAGIFMLILVNVGMPGLFGALQFLAPFLLASTAMPFAFRNDEGASRGPTVAANIATALVSFITVTSAVSVDQIPNPEILYLFAAAIYGGISLLYKKFKLEEESLCSALIALSSATIYLPAAKLGPHNVLTWAIQLALLLWAGFRYNIRSFRWFAYPLSAVTFIACLVEFFDSSTFVFNGANIHWSTLNIVPALLVFASVTSFSNKANYKFISSGAHEFNFYWYLHMFGVVAFLWAPFMNMSINDAAQGATIAGWTALASMGAYLGFNWKRNYVLVFSILTYVCAMLLSFGGQTVPVIVFPSIALLTSLFSMAEHIRVNNYGQSISKNYKNVFFILGTIALFQIQSIHLPSLSQVCLALAIEMFAFIAIGVRIKDKCIRGCGILAATVLNLVLLTNEPSVGLPMICISVMSLYAAAQIYMRITAADISLSARNFIRHALTCGATFTMVHYSGTQLDTHFVSLAWAAEGISLIAAGFMLNDKLLRISGLLVFGLLATHLVFVDLASAATVYRIIAFMVAGLFLMAAAYTYNFFNKKLAAEAKNELLSAEHLKLQQS